MLSNGPARGPAGPFPAGGCRQASTERRRRNKLEASHGQGDEQVPREATRLIHESQPEEEPREGEPQAHTRGHMERVQDLLTPGVRDELDPKPPRQRPDPDQGKD